MLRRMLSTSGSTRAGSAGSVSSRSPRPRGPRRRRRSSSPSARSRPPGGRRRWSAGRSCCRAASAWSLLQAGRMSLNGRQTLPSQYSQRMSRLLAAGRRQLEGDRHRALAGEREQAVVGEVQGVRRVDERARLEGAERAPRRERRRCGRCTGRARATGSAPRSAWRRRRPSSARSRTRSGRSQPGGGGAATRVPAGMRTSAASAASTTTSGARAGWAGIRRTPSTSRKASSFLPGACSRRRAIACR